MQGSPSGPPVPALKALKIIGVTVAGAIVAAYILVAAYGATDTYYRCEGELAGESTTAPAVVVLRHREYRPWLKRWNDSDGAFWLEIPEQAVEYYARSTRTNGVIRIHDADDAIRGHLVADSGALSLNVAEHGTFGGACAAIDR